VLSSRLRKLLTEYYQQLPKTDPQFPLIHSQKSYGAFSPNSLCQLFGRMYETAGVRGATSHSGRRTFITKLASKGVSAKVLMTLAGHKHLRTTQRLRAAVDLL
jgi:integrase/recombinase XerD